MAKCPLCETHLTENDALSGRCPACRSELPASWLAEFPFALKQAAVSSEPMPSDPGENAPEEPLSQEGSLVEAAPAGPVELRETQDGRREEGELPGETLNGSPPASAPASGSSTSPGGSTAPAQPDLTLDVAQRIEHLWGGRLPPNALITMSLKGGMGTVEASTNVVIQPRFIQHPRVPVTQQPAYEILETLGQGGMGVVSAARQTSINRSVAVKMLRADKLQDRHTRQKFLGEAVVTGELEHPNIVPVYDLGKDQTGALFYSMKHVKGRPWDTQLRRKSQEENLEILMKVADAVAFAHSHGVLHRDLKPENVMLGDFGEVMLMDWGLALSVKEAAESMTVAGTPAYMAPEMALGEAGRVGICSDIYLLGAILYDIVCGSPPHTGKSVMECLAAAGRNEIRPTEQTGELVEIARHAMATRPEDRYTTVGEFQAAIRAYHEHAQSIRLSDRAERGLDQAQREDGYDGYARALFGFQEAFALWSGNTPAQQGVVRASLAYASSAYRKGDFDLGGSLLDPDNPEHVPLLRQIRAAQQERASRNKRLKAAKRWANGLVLTIMVVVGIAFLWVRSERDRAVLAEQEAIAQREEAVAARQRADQARQRADAAAEREQLAAAGERAAAETARAAQADAEQSAEKARQAQTAEARQRQQAEREAYMARIGLAAAKIEENAFERARELLDECPAALRDWEWGRLRHLSQQYVREIETGIPLETVAFSPDGRRLVTGGWAGELQVWDPGTGQLQRSLSTGGQYVFSAAFSPDGRYLAAGTNHAPDYVQLFLAESGQPVDIRLRGHTDAVLTLAFSQDGTRLLTGSYDQTARLWNLETGACQVFHGHDSWVWSVGFSPDEQRILTTSQDGSALIWSVASGQSQPPFLGHTGPVYGGAFAVDGRLVATAGYDGRILLWDPEQLRPFDFGVLASDRRNPPMPSEALQGHTAAVRDVRFSPDGHLLVSGGNDNTVRIWDVASRSLLKTLRGHGGRVLACALPTDLSYVLSGSHDQRALLWRLEAYEELRVYRSQILSGHRDAVLGAGFSPDGQRIVSASRDRTAQVWDVETGEVIQRLKEGHDFLVSAGRFFPDGKRILTAAVDNTVRVWNVSTGTQQLTLDATGVTAAVDVAADGRWILTGGGREEVDDGAGNFTWEAQLWDAETGARVRRLGGHGAEVSAVAIGPRAELLFTGDGRGRCRLWDRRTGDLLWEQPGHTRGVTVAAFSQDGQRVLSASADNTVVGWDVAEGEMTGWLLKHPDAVTALAWSPDNRHVLTACADRVARLWDLETNQAIHQWRVGNLSLQAVAFSPRGEAVILASDGTAQFREWDGRQPSNGDQPYQQLQLDPRRAWSLDFSPDGRMLLSAGGDEAQLWDLKTGRPGMQFARQGSIASARFSPDGRRIVTSSWDTTAKIWDAATGVVARRLTGHDGFVNDATFCPENRRVVTASDDRTARLWDAETGELLVRFTGHRDRVRTALFSPDARHVLTASNDGTARIWDTATGTLRHVLGTHDRAVLCAAYSADGRYLVTGGEDNGALVWDVSGEEPAVLARLEGHSAAVTDVAFSPSGTRVVTVSQDHTAIVWDPRPAADAGSEPRGTELLTLKGHTNELTSVSFSPAGRSVLTSCRDGDLILWPTADWNRAAPSRRGLSLLTEPAASAPPP